MVEDNNYAVLTKKKDLVAIPVNGIIYSMINFNFGVGLNTDEIAFLSIPNFPLKVIAYSRNLLVLISRLENV